MNLFASCWPTTVGCDHVCTSHIACVPMWNTTTFVLRYGASQIRVPSNDPPAKPSFELLNPAGHALYAVIDPLLAVTRTNAVALLGYSQWYGLRYALPRNPSVLIDGSEYTLMLPDDSVTRITELPTRGTRTRYVPSYAPPKYS